MQPKVTGLSPMTGPPGTRVTVRGENLGQSSNDIIKLSINGADSLPYLEWKSSKKIIARCSKILGSGDVIVTTKSGGEGICDVQFNCYEEIVGPTDESAVWIDEMDPQAPEKENFNISSPADEYSEEIASTRFKPQLYLSRNHFDSSLDDLAQLRRALKSKLADPETISSNSNRAALLKSNLSVIMEYLNMLDRLSKVLTSSRDTSISSISNSIKDSLDKTHELFDPLLQQNHMVQSIESAMQVFKRRGDSFFDLPLVIENSIRTKNYDSVVKEIAGVKSRLKTINIDSDLRSRIENDVTKKVEKLRGTIRTQLHEACQSSKHERNIEEVKQFISHLNKLDESSSFDMWVVIKEMSDSLSQNLTDEFRHCLDLSLLETEQLHRDKKLSIEDYCQKKEVPPVVMFVQSSINMFNHTYYDILALGQSYFDSKDEFACRDDLRAQRFSLFNETMVPSPINHLCCLLRLALISNSCEKIDKSSFWPNYEGQKDSYSTWLRHALHKDWLRIILHSVITCHTNMTKAILPTSGVASLEEFKKFVVELRRQSLEILFKNAALQNKSLHHREDWIVEVNDENGSITKLPHIFEANVIEILKFAKETILKKSQPEETSILKNVAVQAEMKELAYGLINSFHSSLDNALSSSKEFPAETTLILTAGKESTRVPSQLSNRLLITICNYQFTKKKVFPNLKGEFKRLLELNVEKVFEECGKKYRDYIDKTMNRFCAIKCKELNSNRSDQFKNGKENTPSANFEMQVNLMIANSQIYLIAPQLVDDLMPEIINEMLEEKNRVRL